MNRILNPKNTLILVALEDELPQKLIPSWDIVYTGVGKVNASLAVAGEWPKREHEVILNFGSAGALNPNVNGLVRVSQFMQRDMDARGLGFELGETPFDNWATITLDSEGFSCGSGDSFVMTPPEIKTDVVDMESYAMAKYALQKGVQFICYKYVSDSADGNAPDDWRAHLHKGAEAFVKEVLKKA